ncbi:MAG: tol-pal system protein YbgF [Thermodesulfobacteriota bacterium]
MKRLCKYTCILFFLHAACFSLVSCSGISPVASENADNPEKNELEKQIRQMEKSLEQAEKRQDALEEKIGMLSLQIRDLADEKAKLRSGSSEVKTGFTEPGVLYRKGRNLMLEERFEEASLVFTEFMKKHTAHGLADNAMYWLGECHYSMGDYKQAADTFLALVEKYPKGMKVPDALLKAGYSFLASDDVNRANHYLKKVVKKFPFTSAADKAEEKLSTIK